MPKLAEEARLLKAIQERGDLSADFRKCFPRIFAAKLDQAPFGYLMEAFVGYTGFEKICFGGHHAEEEIQRIGARVLDLLFGAYRSSRNSLLHPNLLNLYFGRIRSRLAAAAQLDAALAKLMENAITINGERYEPPYAYLDRIQPRVRDWEPAFSTFVHGDPNPENILVQSTATHIDVKFIDTKEWPFGDYLFDMGKIAHYLSVTGPAERAAVKPQVSIDTNSLILCYELKVPVAVRHLIESLVARVDALAGSDEFQDVHWKRRYALSMASNLLGIPEGRLKSGRRDSAFITYAEGLKWLKELANE